MKCRAMIFLVAIPLSAASVEGFFGYSPNSPQLFGSARVPCVALIGGDVSVGRTVEYIASFEYLKVPGSGIDNYAVTPIGVRLNAFSRRKVHPFLLIDEGIIASTKPIPYPNDVGLNFLVDFGAGLQLGRVKVGYKLMHISNASTYKANPGLDSNVFFVSFTFHKGGK